MWRLFIFIHIAQSHAGRNLHRHGYRDERQRHVLRARLRWSGLATGWVMAEAEPCRNPEHSRSITLYSCVSALAALGEERRPLLSMRTILLLTVSNIFMTFAWYGHLKYREVPLFKVIVISWLIAFFEYCFQVPANRIGSYEFSAAQLKTIQEVITLIVFSVFSVFYLKQPVKWNHAVGFAMIVAAVAVIFKQW
jgi:hypothetical protein